MASDSGHTERKVPDIGSGKARPRSKQRRAIAIPLITGLVLILVFCAYYFVYVGARQEYLTNRNFRALAVLGNQLQRSINIHATVLQTFVDQRDQVSPPEHERRKEPLGKFLRMTSERESERESGSHEDRMQYLRFLAPGFELEEITDVGERSQLTVSRTGGTWKLELATSTRAHPQASKEQHTTYIGAIKVSDVLKPFVSSLPFDDILLASQNGIIVYEKSLTGPQFTTLGALLGDETANGQNKKRSSDANAAQDNSSTPQEKESSAQVQLNSDKAWRSRSVHLTEVAPAGAKYTVFLQPVVIDYGTNGKFQNEPREWVLCGLIKSKTLQWEALAVSYTIILWLVAAFLIVCLSAPILKVFLLNQWEHLKRRELAFVGLFLILLSCVCTLSFLQAIYYHFIADRTDEMLSELALNLSANMGKEMLQMRQQLLQVCSSDQIKQDLHTAKQVEVIRRLSPDKSKDALRTPEAHLLAYPYFDNVFWTDSDGHQIVKWGTSSYVTPMIDVSGLPSYKQLSDPEQHSLMYLDSRGPPFVLDSVIPVNRLDYLAQLGMSTCYCNPELCRTHDIGWNESRGYAFIVARPFSMMQPLLRYGYGFALLDRSGSVLFHTDKTRNTLENFLQESDRDRQLYAAMFGHSNNRSITITYMGTPVRARVIPISGLAQAPWSLVVFRDLTFVRTLNLQTTTMAATLFLIILSLPVVLAVIWRGSCRPRFVAEWLWPHSGRTFTYVYQAVLYAVLAILLVLTASFSSSEETLVACAAIPYTAFAFTFFAMRLFPSGVADAREPRRLEIILGGLTSATGAIALLWFVLSEWPHLNALFWLVPFWLLATVPLFSRPRTRLMEAFRRRFVKSRGASAGDAQPFGASYMTLYGASALLLLLLVGVLTPLFLFRNVRRVEGRLLLKQSQLRLASAAEREQALLQSQCDSQQRSLAECREFGVAGQPESTERGVTEAPRTDAWSRQSLRPLYKMPGSDFKNRPDSDFVPHSTDLAEEFYTPWFQHLVYVLHHDYNQPAAEMLGVIADRGIPKGGNSAQGGAKPDALPEWVWTQTETNISLRKHGSEPTRYSGRNEMDMLLHTPISFHTARDTAIAIAATVFVMFLIGGVFWVLARRIFLFHVVPHRITGRRQAAEAIRAGKNVVVLVPPGMQWELDVPTWPLNLNDLAKTPTWGKDFDLAAVPMNKLIEIRYSPEGDAESEGAAQRPTSEQREEQARLENQKLLFLRRLIARPATQVAVIMAVGASMEEYAREFPEFEVVDLREQPLLWEKAYSGPAKGSLWRECAPLPVLWPLGAQLARDLSMDNELQPDRTYTEAAIAAEVLEKAEPYYRMIWEECSPLQKFVLSQLASDGVPNPVNDRILQQFVRRGLIVKDPQFRIMNESFRRFLAAAPTPRLKNMWTRDSRKSGWGKAHGAFFVAMLVIGAFLLTTQNELWQSSAAYVTTAFGALGTLAKLFNAIRGGGVPSSDQEG